MPNIKNLFGNKSQENTANTQQTVASQDNQQYVDREPKEENPQKYIQTDAAGGRNREMVLHYLGINDDGEDVQLSKMVTPDEVRDVEFSTSVPTGLDADEVEHFCNVIEANVSKYRELIKQDRADKEKLVGEVLRVDKQVQESKQKRLMEGQFGDDQSRVQELNERILTLQNKLAQAGQGSPNAQDVDKQEKTIKELRSKLKDYKKSESANKELRQQIVSLQKELEDKDEEMSSQKKSYEERINKLTSTSEDEPTVQAKNEKLTQDLQAANDMITKLTNQVNDTTNEDKLRQTISSLKDNNSKLKETIEQLTSERDNALQISNAANSDGQAQLDEMTSRYQKAQDEIKQAHQQIADLQAEIKSDTKDAKREQHKKDSKQQDSKHVSQDDSEYEDEVIRNLKDKQPIAQKQKQLSKDDIKRMRASENTTSYDFSKKQEKKKTQDKPKQTSSDESFNSMFDDMKNNY